MDNFGRNLFAVGLDRATRFPQWSQQSGYSDQLMMMGQSGKSSYRPEVMDYANRLTHVDARVPQPR
jgi:hypothetical protein